MTCFITCAAEEETNEGEKKSCSITIRRLMNMLRQSETCTVFCKGEKVKRGRKKQCFISFFVSLRKRFICTCGGDE